MSLIATDKLEREKGASIFFKLGENEAAIFSALLEAYGDRCASDEDDSFRLFLAAIQEDLDDMIQFFFRKPKASP